MSEVGTEVDDLKWADDRIEAGKFETKGGEVNLLDFDAGGCIDCREESLEFFEALAVGVFDRGALEDEAEILTEAALNGIVEGKIEDAVGGFAGDDASVE